MENITQAVDVNRPLALFPHPLLKSIPTPLYICDLTELLHWYEKQFINNKFLTNHWHIKSHSYYCAIQLLLILLLLAVLQQTEANLREKRSGHYRMKPHP